jgi:Domain of unknown function (DUF1918)
MKAEVGDRIIVEAEKVGQSTRTGVVEEVLAPEPPRLRVRWDDGHSTVFPRLPEQPRSSLRSDNPTRQCSPWARVRSAS